MNLLSDSQVDSWLFANFTDSSPYENGTNASNYLQFALPDEQTASEAVLRGILSHPSQESLLHIIDWSHYTPDQMNLFDALPIRAESNAKLIEKPGHQIRQDEMAAALTAFLACTSFGWTSYWYFPRNQLTILSWEREFVDVWTTETAIAKFWSKRVEEFKLQVTSAGV